MQKIEKIHKLVLCAYSNEQKKKIAQNNIRIVSKIADLNQTKRC